MHVHILKKVWDHKHEVTGTQTHCHTGTPQVSIKLWIGGGPDMGSQVDINSCPDACTHSKKRCGTTSRVTGTHDTVTQEGHASFHETMHRKWCIYQQSGRHKFTY